MMQHPAPGEIVAEVPGHGPLVEFNRGTMQRVFGGLLASGRVTHVLDQRCIEWSVDTDARLDPSDPSAIEAAARLIELADRAERAGHELADRIVRHEQSADPGAPLRIPLDLALRMGAQTERDISLYAEGEVRPLRDALLRLSRAVRRAVARGDFVRQGDRVLLYGWGFLSQQDLELGASTQLKGRVTLELLPLESQPDRQIEQLRFVAHGGADEVELLRVDGAESVVSDTRRPLKGDPAEGIWAFASGDLAPGTRYRARARGKWGVVDSETVEMPARGEKAQPLPPVMLGSIEPVAEPPKDPPPSRGRRSVAAPFQPPPIQPPPIEPQVQPSEPQTRRVPRWLLWIAALLLFGLLLWLLWLLLPYPMRRAGWGRVRTGEHLARNAEDVDPDPADITKGSNPDQPVRPGQPFLVSPGDSRWPGWYVQPNDGTKPVWVAPPDERPQIPSLPSNPQSAQSSGGDAPSQTEHAPQNPGPQSNSPSEQSPSNEAPKQEPERQPSPQPEREQKPKRVIPKVEPLGDSGATPPTASAPSAEAAPREQPKVPRRAIPKVKPLTDESKGEREGEGEGVVKPSGEPTPVTPPRQESAKDTTAEPMPASAPDNAAPAVPTASPDAQAEPSAPDTETQPPAPTDSEEAPTDAASSLAAEGPSDHVEPQPASPQFSPPTDHPPIVQEAAARQPEYALRVSWPEQTVEIMLSGSAGNQSSVSPLVGLIVEAEYAGLIPDDPVEAEAWAKRTGCRVFSASALQSDPARRLLLVDPKSLLVEGDRRFADIPCVGTRFVLGLRYEQPRRSDVPIDVRVELADGAKLLPGRFAGQSEGWRDSDGRAMELIQMPISAAEGSDQVDARFQDGVYRLRPFTMERRKRDSEVVGGGA